VDRLARIYEKGGEYAKALAEYRYGLAVNPDKAPYYHRKMAQLYQKLGLPIKASHERELARRAQEGARLDPVQRRLRDWEKEGEYDLLLQEYRYLYRRHPDEKEYYLRKIIRTAEKAGDERQAVEGRTALVRYYREEIKAEPERESLLRCRLASVYADSGDFDQALREYGLAAEADVPAQAGIELKKAELLARIGRKEAAEEVLSELEGVVPPEEVEFRTRMARLAGRLGDEARELDTYRQLASLPGGEGLSRRIAELLWDQKRYDEAAKAYEEAIEASAGADRARLLESLGDLKTETGNVEAARDLYARALYAREEFDATGTITGPGLSQTLRLAEKAALPEKMREYRDRLVSYQLDLAGRDPDQAPGIYRRLGNRFRREGRLDEARNIYLIWHREFADDPSPLFRLYLLYSRDRDDAETGEYYLERYRELKKSMAEAGNG